MRWRKPITCALRVAVPLLHGEALTVAEAEAEAGRVLCVVWLCDCGCGCGILHNASTLQAVVHGGVAAQGAAVTAPRQAHPRATLQRLRVSCSR